MSDIESIFKQVLFNPSSHHSTALLVTPGTSYWFSIHHVVIICHLSHLPLILALTLSLIFVGQLGELGPTVIFYDSGCQVQYQNTSEDPWD